MLTKNLQTCEETSRTLDLYVESNDFFYIKSQEIFSGNYKQLYSCLLTFLFMYIFLHNAQSQLAINVLQSITVLFYFIAFFLENARSRYLLCFDQQ